MEAIKWSFESCKTWHIQLFNKESIYLLYILFSPYWFFSCVFYRIVENLIHFFDNLQMFLEMYLQMFLEMYLQMFLEMYLQMFLKMFAFLWFKTKEKNLISFVSFLHHILFH